MSGFTLGREYRFLSDGHNILRRFDGLGQHMRAVWHDVATGTEVELHPYRSFKAVYQKGTSS